MKANVKHKEVISNTLQFIAVLTVISAGIILALILSHSQISMF